jgi:hypothetical protein
VETPIGEKSSCAWIGRFLALLQHGPANLYGRVWIGFNNITLRPSMNVNPSDLDRRHLFSFRAGSLLVCRGLYVLFSLSIS